MQPGYRAGVCIVSPVGPTGRTGGMLGCALLLALFLVVTPTGLVALAEVSAEPFHVIADTFPDAAPRRTDYGGCTFDYDAHRLPDLKFMVLSRWASTDPPVDLFSGVDSNGGLYFRLELVLAGLLNPPGPASPEVFDPFRYGPHPVYGFVEIDVDEDEETGGELDAPEFRYLGNIVRFGGKPAVNACDERVAEDESAFDGDITTPPYVDRHGEDFHLALLGGQFSWSDVRVVEGDADQIFEAGEVWRIRACWFHRAHGYEPFSLATGGAYPGEYMPVCTLEFRHDVVADQTHVTLVVPLTNLGAAKIEDEAPESSNGDPSDQASVLEGLMDLKYSAEFLDEFPTGLPEEIIIIEWCNKVPVLYLSPPRWRATALLGTSYTSPDPAGQRFIWTDAYPDVIRGDVNGDGEADQMDRSRIAQVIANEDADDGVVDGRVVIDQFPTRFSVYDINHEGVIDDLDVALVSRPGDTDGDDDMDLADFMRLQACFSGRSSPYAVDNCGLLDFDADGDVDEGDVDRFVRVLSGPG